VFIFLSKKNLTRKDVRNFNQKSNNTPTPNRSVNTKTYTTMNQELGYLSGIALGYGLHDRGVSSPGMGWEFLSSPPCIHFLPFIIVATCNILVLSTNEEKARDMRGRNCHLENLLFIQENIELQ
jgi:hypothetical protein